MLKRFFLTVLAVTLPFVSLHAAMPKPPKAAVFVSGLETPWALDFALDGRIFVTERPGRIRVIQQGALLPAPWFTVDTKTTADQETGLFGLALDPNFGVNGFIYVTQTYTEGDKILGRLLRLRDVNGQGTLSRILVDGVPGGLIHNGGRVKIGPDNKLYWSIGDTGNENLAQDPASLAGKILRIDLDGGIPEDNPTKGSYVYASGFQNALGLAWDPNSGLLYSTDQGPNGTGAMVGQDEINLIEPGKNYGWPVIYGSRYHAGMESPIVQSTIARTWAPASCLFIRGGKWNGSLIFAGLKSQTLYRLTISPRNSKKITFFEELFTGDFGRLREVAEGPDGTIYLTTSQSDGSGTPSPDGDKILIITP